MNKRLFLTLFLCFYSLVVMSEQKGRLMVSVSGVTSSNGQVILSVFNSEENYLTTPFISAKEKTDDSGEVVFHLSGLSDGEYALSAFHDEDENGELNTNFFGIPIELVGFSNNAKGSFGPPSFNQVKIKISEHQKVSINLIAVGE